MHPQRLDDVREAIARGQKGLFQSMKVYVTGFAQLSESLQNNFFYRGCTAVKDDGFLCRKTVEGSRQCRDHSSAPWDYMYRLDIFLADETLSPTSPPLRVTVFEAAATLLGMEVDVFVAMDELSQFLFLHSATQKSTMVDVCLPYKPKDKFAIVQRLCLQEDCIIMSSRPGPSTPMRSPRPGPSSTPSRLGPSPTPSSSSSASAQKKLPKELLFELLESLGHAKLTD